MVFVTAGGRSTETLRSPPAEVRYLKQSAIVCHVRLPQHPRAGRAISLESVVPPKESDRLGSQRHGNRRACFDGNVVSNAASARFFRLPGSLRLDGLLGEGSWSGVLIAFAVERLHEFY